MIKLDYTFMTDGAVQGAIADSALTSASDSFGAAMASVTQRWKSGELGWFDLPDDKQARDECIELAGAARRRGVEDVVVLGIGGSGLGPIALRTALLPPAWNALSRLERKEKPRLHVLDNVDPVTIAALLDRLDLSTTLFIATSKSGGTGETMAQYLVVRGRLDAAGFSARHHFVFVTDPEKGALRKIARDEGIPTAAVPPDVGGRFSVLSPVGLLPAAMTGIDVDGLLAGAADMRERCQATTWSSNPAGA